MTESVRHDLGQAAQVSTLHHALRRARRVLWHSQRADGSWDAPGEMGPSPTAQVVVALHFLKRLSPEEGALAARWLRTQQRQDGSFPLSPFARRGDLGATASVWAALQVAAPSDPATREAISRARAFIEQQGGLDAVVKGIDAGDVSAVFLALAGVLEPARLPCPPAAFALVPPLRHALEKRFHSGVLMMALQLNVLSRRLRGEFGRDGQSMNPLERAECRAAIQLLETFQNRDGSWNGNTLQGALALPALHAAGLPLEDERIRRGIAWLEAQKVQDASGLRFDAFSSGVWSTAFDVRALLAAGAAPGDERIHRALGWLMESQLQIPQPEVDNSNPGAPRTGGWAFQRGNHTMADCDDAGVVLSALGQALSHRGPGGLDEPTTQKVRASIQRGVDWLFGMQNPDGGWSAFVWGLPGKKRGAAMTHTVRARLDEPLSVLRLLFDPEPALGDPSTEDLTARVLHGLGQAGYTVQSSPAVARAVEFLEAQQCSDGSFWGRWVVNYLSATSFVLMGLRAVGVDMREPWVQAAARWVLAKQNEDGGWGELPDSYARPELAGRGPSMAPLTGLVVQGLIDAGEGGSEAVARGVEFLLRRQRPDGSWPNDDYLHANVPPDTFYCYPEAAKFYPTEALARYVAFRSHPAPPPAPRWTDAQLDAARQRTDLLAERVVSEIVAEGEIAAVNQMLGVMFRSDEPIPEGLPPRARRYFEETAAIPGWVDREKIALAQRLFTRAGWEVATSLFCSALPQAYAAAKGAEVLTLTGGMMKHLRQRIFETAQFIFDVLDEGGLEPNGRGLRATQKLRLMHAGIRYLILSRTDPAWDSATLGMPINQEDLAGTLCTFSVVTLDSLQAFGVQVSPEEGEAWVHLWNLVGTVLGIDAELLAMDVDDGHALMQAIRERQWARSEAGRTLIRPLMELMEGFIPGKGLDGVPVALVRHLAGDHCADLLGLPPADWTSLLIDAAEVLDPLVTRTARDLGMQRVFGQMRQAIMHAVVGIEREGKHVRFRIPPSLTQTIDPRQ